MKALGMVRKIDQLGRIVIPKEIRDAQGWDEGQPMEMFMVEDNLLLRGYGRDREKTAILHELELAQTVTEDKKIKKAIQTAMDYISKG